MENYKGLYIHIPFCLKKCKYCDFVSFVGKESQIDLYIEELLKEALKYKGERIDTIFLGGGTPSVLSAQQLDKLLTGISGTFDFDCKTEATIEINPQTINEEKLLVLKNSLINRLSIGVQSFCDSELKSIGRIHNSKTAYNTVEMIKKFQFNNFNLDIMLNLPNQSVESLKNTLKTAVSLNPAHISCYSLILEENTPLFDEYKEGVYKEPEDEYDRELYHFTKEFLKEHGYEQYEISNFSKRGMESKHNLKYWNCDEYIGLGASAHSYLNGIRFYNTSNLENYLSGNHFEDKTILSFDDKISEYIIMRLRLNDGIYEKEFLKRFNKNFYNEYKPIIDKFINQGFMTYENDAYKLTEKGIDVSNSIMCEFV